MATRMNFRSAACQLAQVLVFLLVSLPCQASPDFAEVEAQITKHEQLLAEVSSAQYQARLDLAALSLVGGAAVSHMIGLAVRIEEDLEVIRALERGLKVLRRVSDGLRGTVPRFGPADYVLHVASDRELDLLRPDPNQELKALAQRLPAIKAKIAAGQPLSPSFTGALESLADETRIVLSR